MVLDSSAIVAILFDEPDAETYRVAVFEDETRLVSAATLLEASLVIERRKGEPGGRELDLFVSRAAIEIVPVDADQFAAARRAWRKFGRGRHAAGLNHGNLFAYALARVTGQPLLFKGDAFARTDVARVI
jgi:ribonuclease VapC